MEDMGDHWMLFLNYLGMTDDKISSVIADIGGSDSTWKIVCFDLAIENLNGRTSGLTDAIYRVMRHRKEQFENNQTDVTRCLLCHNKKKQIDTDLYPDR